MCAAVQTLVRATSTTSSGNDSASRLWSAGIAASSGNRAASAITIVCLAPIRAISEPAKRGSVTNGMLPIPRTSPSFVADPVVTRTNQGSANTVIDEPIDDTTSAATIARI